MSRPQEYDLEEVLQKATHLFWQKGFEGTSMNDIVSKTGLNKRSLYNKFGHKEGLFLGCVDYYADHDAGELGDLLRKEPLGLGNIKTFFNNRIDYAASKNSKGCLLINSVTEKELLTEKINLRVKSLISDFTMLFYDCLKAAQENNEISDDKDCRALANYMSCLNNGLLNVGKNDTKKQELRQIVDIALSTLKT